MHLQPVTLYPFQGENLPLAKVREKLENALGTIIDQAGIQNARDRLRVLEMLTKHAGTISEILSATYGDPDEPEAVFP